MGRRISAIEPFDDGLHLRYRVDGVLQDYPDPPAGNLAAAIASRIKLLSQMNIAERRLPQDGRIMTRVKATRSTCGYRPSPPCTVRVS